MHGVPCYRKASLVLSTSKLSFPLGSKSSCLTMTGNDATFKQCYLLLYRCIPDRSSQLRITDVVCKGISLSTKFPTSLNNAVHSCRVSALACSSTNTVLTGSYDGILRLWNSEGPSLRHCSSANGAYIVLRCQACYKHTAHALFFVMSPHYRNMGMRQHTVLCLWICGSSILPCFT